ncbi:MAG: phytoene desaturase family protein [Acidimicrobiia bacterium]
MGRPLVDSDTESRVRPQTVTARSPHLVTLVSHDAVVVGSGPNGLAAAVELTRTGRRVLVIEGARDIGGGARTKELTLPGFLHDVCSAIHPLGAASPFFRDNGIGDWVHPEIPATHPLDGGRVVVLERSLGATAAGLGSDARRYERMFGGFAKDADALMDQVLSPMSGIPKNPLAVGRFGAPGIFPASVAVKRFRTEEARALYAGLAAHAIAPFSAPLTGAVAQTFAVAAHAHGWPAFRGGSVGIADEMVRVVEDGGGSIETSRLVTSPTDLPDAPIVLLDVMPPAAIQIAGDRLDSIAARRLAAWKFGPGAFKIDWALDEPIPWTDEASRRAGTVHVGGTYDEIAAAEAAVHRGEPTDRPFVIVTQQSLFDASRSPEGKHVAWAYCHVPSGSDIDRTEVIESQIERFAPGFRDVILATHTIDPRAFEEYNPNYVGGDFAGGAFTASRVFRFGSARPYRIGEGVYLCSSATPPGAGVHGMCGFHAARVAIADQT